MITHESFVHSLRVHPDWVVAVALGCRISRSLINASLVARHLQSKIYDAAVDAFLFPFIATITTIATYLQHLVKRSLNYIPNPPVVVAVLAQAPARRTSRSQALFESSNSLSRADLSS
jgi:hypothetical protein